MQLTGIGQIAANVNAHVHVSPRLNKNKQASPSVLPARDAARLAWIYVGAQ
jgi:hypothetical protein